MKIEISLLRRDGGTQPRAAIDYEVAYEYGDEMKAGAVFPPVVAFYDGSDYWLADGFHRVEGAYSADIETIECDVRQGNLQDAQWFSFSVNATHGLRRTNADKRRAVEAALLHPAGVGLSDNKISEHVGVSQQMVSGVRADLIATNKISKSATTGKDGRTYKPKSEWKRPRTQQPKPDPPTQPDPEPDNPTEDQTATDHGDLVDVPPAPVSVAAPTVQVVPNHEISWEIGLFVNNASRIMGRGYSPEDLHPYFTPDQYLTMKYLYTWLGELEEVHKSAELDALIDIHCVCLGHARVVHARDLEEFMRVKAGLTMACTDAMTPEERLRIQKKAWAAAYRKVARRPVPAGGRKYGEAIECPAGPREKRAQAAHEKSA